MNPRLYAKFIKIKKNIQIYLMRRFREDGHRILIKELSFNDDNSSITLRGDIVVSDYGNLSFSASTFFDGNTSKKPDETAEELYMDVVSKNVERFL